MIMKNKLELRLITFSTRIINFSDNLVSKEASRVLTSQILRSATSIALNYGEAQNAQTKKDFIYKVRIAYKELRETNVNLKIIEEAKLFRNKNQIIDLLGETAELLAIFTTILKTANKNQSKNK